ASYMDSLRLVESRRPDLLCPGHGPFITDAMAKVAEYIDHREGREAALVETLDSGVRTRMELLDTVWSDVHEVLRPAAAVVVEAQLQKLANEGRLPSALAEWDGSGRRSTRPVGRYTEPVSRARHRRLTDRLEPGGPRNGVRALDDLQLPDIPVP